MSLTVSDLVVLMSLPYSLECPLHRVHRCHDVDVFRPETLCVPLTRAHSVFVSDWTMDVFRPETLGTSLTRVHPVFVLDWQTRTRVEARGTR